MQLALCCDLKQLCEVFKELGQLNTLSAMWKYTVRVVLMVQNQLSSTQEEVGVTQCQISWVAIFAVADVVGLLCS